ncbi:MAG TPA: discoidin domain-containing protein [Verrucomicrobiae bacterium]|nr:discoidin domain-containing protein [Verrucomicrobiae bacterium]
MRTQRHPSRGLTGLASVALLCLGLQAVNSAPERLRNVLSLDGTWQIAEGKMDQVPVSFERTVPVPGLVALATPEFANPPGPKVTERNKINQKDPKRDAFWYRRTFRLDQPLRAVALLKVRKAMFGTRVILNGQVLGDHLPSFTAGCFDAKAALKAGQNELLIRVGADRDAVGPRFPNGFDYEKERYIPGIFDSVELILSGTPHFTQVQAAPDIATGAVRVQAVLRNDGEAVRTVVNFTVREAKSGREAGRLSTESLSIEKGAETTVDVRIPVAGCHLWSPEEPFLYTLEAENGADRFQTRFGMRELRFDPATGHARLNGKPYFMRGSNITLYRFFEDSQCKDLPWRNAWVRLLLQRVKQMHWNSLRCCIGFPPEAWYDAADELGILIQDEFPVWYGGSGWSTWPKELKSGELALEYAEWMRERWNHPCVVVWDASNETASPETGLAIKKVRDLDLSHRPWDNSYSDPMEPGDVFESHPYHFNPNFRLSDLATTDPVPQGNQVHNDGKHAVIINEYGWHWVNRDGTPTTLTRELYRVVLGERATAAQRFHMQATWLAADTEFWRAHRKAAAVLHFTMLGYSRPDGQTCDHWKPGGVEELQWEPEFYRYVRDAFAPVGLMVDFWKDRNICKTQSRVPIILIDDLDRPWGGSVSLRLYKAQEAVSIFEMKQEASVGAFGQATIEFEVTWPKSPGQYVLDAALRGVDGQTVHSVRELETIGPRALGLAYRKPASASSSQAKEYLPANAVDGDTATYWSSTFADPAWLAVDLGELSTISRVRITWERAYSREFEVQVSSDGQNWIGVFTEKNCKGGVSEIKLAPLRARHVRIWCVKRATQWGHAIRELEVFS